MGLDQNIYKNNKSRKQTQIEYDSVIKESNNYLKILMENNKDISIIVTDFITRHKDHLIAPDSENTNNTITNSVKSILYGNTDFSTVKWNLFNNYSRFNYDTYTEDKLTITTDLLKSLEKYPVTKEQFNRLKLEKKLYKRLGEEQEEVAYWRKNHDLNDFILNTFGGGNCEDTVLSKNSMIQIEEFIKEQKQDKDNQVTKILTNWNASCTYIYNPWW